VKPQQVDLFALKKQVIEELKSELDLVSIKPNPWTKYVDPFSRVEQT
jgi:hypothetical protein